MTNSIFGIVIALISTATWAICSIIFKHLGERLEPVGMTMLKTIFSSILLFIIAILSQTSLNIETDTIIKIALSGILGIAVGDSLFFASLNRLSPLTLSLILFVLPDLFAGIFGLIFLEEMPPILSWVGIFTILVGLAFLIFPINSDNSSSKTKITGLIFALLSIIFTAYSSVLIKPILVTTSVITVTIYRMFFAAIVLLIYALFSKKIFNWKETLTDTNYNLKLSGTFSLVTIGGFWLSLVAIKYCKLIIASSIMSLEPLFILIFMILFNHYKPKNKECLGIIVTVIGILLICAS